MPTKANEIENKIACPSCGATLLKSGYCPKCHRKKDGTIVKTHGKRMKRDSSGKFSGKVETEEPPAPAAPPAPITAQDFSSPPKGDTEEFLCEGCRAKVAYLQRKCKKCGIYLDWRGTEAETDADVIICPQCGAFCGYAEDNPGICPHCHFRG